MKRFLNMLLVASFLAISFILIGATLMGTNYSRCEQILLEMTRTKREIDHNKAEVAKWEPIFKYWNSLRQVPIIGFQMVAVKTKRNSIARVLFLPVPA